MNRGEIAARVISRSDRTDSASATLIDSWIDEVVRTVEQAYPFSYCKKSQTATIPAANKTFTLPSTLILLHPFSMLLVDTTTSPTTHRYMVKAGDLSANYNFPQPTTSAEGPEYWILRGGTNGLNFDVYPVQDADRTLRLQSGYFYSGALADDSATNWLLTHYPDVVIEGVSNKLFEHYGEPQKADRAYQRYQAFMHGEPDMGITGIIQAEKKMQRSGRMSRMRTLDDFPIDIARKKKYVGY